MTNRLAEWLNHNQRKNKSCIIWAYDPTLDKADVFTVGKEIIDDIASMITGVKLNHQIAQPYGVKSSELQSFIKYVHTFDLPVIMDEKINDIGYTNYSIASNYYSIGFDAIICNPFVGWDEGLDQVFQSAEKFNTDVILLVYMSHKGAQFGFGRKVETKNGLMPFYQLFATCVNEWNAVGGIVGATQPVIIKEVRKIFSPEKLIISPGIGAQGGDIKEDRKAGMDFGIVGRSITENPNRKNTLLDFNKIE